MQKVAELAQPILYTLQLQNADARNEINNIKLACDTMYVDLNEKRRQVLDWASIVEAQFLKIPGEVSTHFNQVVLSQVDKTREEVKEVVKAVKKLEQDAHKAIQDLNKNLADLTTKMPQGVMNPAASPGRCGT